MFQFPEFAPVHLCIQCTVAGITGAGFPIRTSSVQSLCSNSPKLFAATNVLHRLLVPRHPPYTLSSLALFFPKAPTSFTTPRSARGCKLRHCAQRHRSIHSISIYLSHSIVKELRLDIAREVEDVGLEPTTLGLQSRCSPS